MIGGKSDDFNNFITFSIFFENFKFFVLQSFCMWYNNYIYVVLGGNIYE